MRALRKFCIIASLTVGLAVTSIADVDAWSTGHHDDITRALVDAPSGAESPSNSPDDWWLWSPWKVGAPKSEHFAAYLPGNARYYGEWAIYYYYYNDDSNGDKNLGYMLHFVQDAGQPWHVSGSIGDNLTGHLNYELEVMWNQNDPNMYLGRSFKQLVTYGSQYPLSACRPSSGSDIARAVNVLMDQVAPYYQYISPGPGTWGSSTGHSYTGRAMLYTGSCAQAIVDYVLLYK